MTDSATLRLQRCLVRLQKGDGTACKELLTAACERLEHLTRKMLNDYGGVRRWQLARIRLPEAMGGELPGL